MRGVDGYPESLMISKVTTIVSVVLLLLLISSVGALPGEISGTALLAGKESGRTVPFAQANGERIKKLKSLRADWGRLKYGIVNFNRSSQKIVDWMDDHYALRISGKKPYKGSLWMLYIDFHRLNDTTAYLQLKDFSRRHDIDAEAMFLHAKTNYLPKTAPSSKQLDMFDVFEGKNGVIKSMGDKKFVDVTRTAYRGEVELSEITYIGYEEPFDRINFELKSPGVETVLAPSYWNGKGWAPLVISDTTAGLTGNGRISFVPPTEWRMTSVNNSRSKYFVRLELVKSGRVPVSSRIYGDSWYDDGGKSCRGWDDLDKQIISADSFRYNPSPLPTSSARFPYQGRVCPTGAPYQFILNHADSQTIGGKQRNTFALFLAERIVILTGESGHDGVMGDEADNKLAYDGIDEKNTDFQTKSRKGWQEEKLDFLRELVADVRGWNPSLLVGMNGLTRDMIYLTDWNVVEYISLLAPSGDSLLVSYDDYLPARNPGGSIGLLLHSDTAAYVPDKELPWDQGNRGPLRALSLHYMGMNENTLFGYHTTGGWRYPETDEVYLKNGDVVHLSSGIVPHLEEVKRWSTWFPAMDVIMGAPDLKGENHGKRVVPWKNGAEIGGGTDIWRRDFEQSVVFHRPATWRSTPEEYQTYSKPVELEREYYPLRADGSTGPAVRSLKLRTGEGAIFMKKQINLGWL